VQAPPPQGQPQAPQPQNLTPGGAPNDPFAKPVPQPTPPPNQPQGANLSGASSSSGFASTAESGGLSIAAATAAPVYDLDPSSASLKAGEAVTVSVRATGDSLPPSVLAVRFDPAVLSVIGVEPIIESAGEADTRLEPGRVVLELPGGTALAGTKPIARIRFQGVAAGRSVVSFDQAPGSTSSATLVVH
jgi:hypothetical protein